MLPRHCHQAYSHLRLFRLCRHVRSSTSSSPSPSSTSNSDHTQKLLEFSKEVTDGLENRQIPPRIIHQTSHSLPPLSSSLSPSRISIILSAAFLSAAVSSYLIFTLDNSKDLPNSNSNRYRHLYSSIEHTIDRSNESAKKIIHRMKQTGVAASVLWQSLWSVLSSANHEVRAGFEFRVASFLADIAAASPSRRAAIVAAGGGKVLDWLLVSVGTSAGDGNGTQAEAARALAYMIADPNVRQEVFARPHAVPLLLRFIFSSQPQRAKMNLRRSSFDLSDSLKGRSMLVAAIMDVVTSNCESGGKTSLHPYLPANAETSDIAVAIRVIEGGMNVDDSHGNEDDDGGKGLKGIGIKVTGETTVLGLSRTSQLIECSEGTPIYPERYTSKNFSYQRRNDNFFGNTSLSSAVVPGLWDDLHSCHVAVPFAVWALANWAMASEVNRIHIQDLDQDGHAVATALAAPERSVKWHASLVARLLLEDNDLPLNDSVSEWSSNLLSTISHACKTEDFPLAETALAAFLLSLERSSAAKRVIVEKGLNVMRDTAKRTTKHKDIQESLAKALKLIYSGDMCLSLEESQKWSGVLLPWACGKFTSENTKSSATTILSHILEDFGPMSLSVSQSWLTLLLTEILGSIKAEAKENIQPKSDKVKRQINQANISSASQIANQLVSAVVSLAGSQAGAASYSADTFPLADLLSQEPFVGLYKIMNKNHSAKFHVADSAMATLKGIKALTEVCAEDPLYQNQIVDSGVLCLLRRYLLRDDYEKLAAIEAYDASRDRELEHQVSNDTGQSIDSNADESSRVRIPPTAHIRRHAARLLMILSALPKVQNIIIADDSWCEWLELCANGKIPGCNDPKIQSYSRATLLNVHCLNRGDADSGKSSGSGDGGVIENCIVPRYDDMIFLINPESSHWKCPDKPESWNIAKEISYASNQSCVERSSVVTENHGSLEVSSAKGYEGSQAEGPSLDVVFVHGLRGGPFKTWRISEDKASTKSGLVEKIDQEAGKQGTFWPGEWLPVDFPHARLFSLKYKSNLTQWSGASLPLQEVSSLLLEKIVAAGIGSRPVVFVTHSMGGLVVKQLLYQAKAENLDNLVRNTIGVVFYSCPHFGSKLADMPWRMGLVLRPAPSIGELRSGSARLVELNDFIRRLHKKKLLEVLSFCETKVTPIVEGYGGWALRMEIVPIESAYPGYGDIVVLESTDHINSCKPLSRDDPSYTQVLEFLRKLKAEYT